MTREILFRGKRLADGEWVESGSLLRTKNEETGEIIIFLGSAKPAVYIFNTEKDVVSVTSLGECIYYRVDPDTIGQYAGLTDKNDKKIFEGDIVRYGNKTGHINYGEGCFSVRQIDPPHSLNNPAIDIVFNENRNDVEVIGNIHDNPELLEGEG